MPGPAPSKFLYVTSSGGAIGDTSCTLTEWSSFLPPNRVYCAIYCRKILGECECCGIVRNKEGR